MKYNGQTHNDIFANLQKEYFKKRDNKILEWMYEVAKEAAKNYILKYCRSHGIKLNIDELSHESAVYIIEQYLRKPSFHVDKLSAYIYFGTRKVLFKDKEKEQREVSYEQYFEEKRDYN